MPTLITGTAPSQVERRALVVDGAQARKAVRRDPGARKNPFEAYERE